jgi:hypothetical protein
MMSDTEFFGRPYFTSDMGGTAVVKKDAKEVEVVFDREYIEAPILSASMAYSTSTDEAEIDAMFNDDVRFVVTKRDTKGFTIRLNKPASRDIVFNWIALAIKDSKEFTSKTVAPNSSNTTATTTPAITGTATTTPITGNSGGVGTTTQVIDPSTASTTPVTATSSPVVPDPIVEVTPPVEIAPVPVVDTITITPPVEAPATDPTPTVTP